MDDYKTGSLGRDDEEVAYKLKHRHRYRWGDVKNGASITAKCVVCEKEAPSWVTRSSGTETTRTT